MKASRVKKLLQQNLANPTPLEQEKILQTLRTFSMEEVLEFYEVLKSNKFFKGPYITKGYISGATYTKARGKRKKNYVSSIKQAANKYLQTLPLGGTFCDVGCGTGVVTLEILGNLLQKGGRVYGCDVVNYLDSTASQYFHFTQTDGLTFLERFPKNYFDGIIETVTLHHLDSKDLYREYIQAMVRVVKEGGLIILLETTHTNWNEHLKNAVLDMVSNDTTSRMIEKSWKRSIPVPIQFLSDKEIQEELFRNGVELVKNIKLKTTRVAPQIHRLYISKKKQQLTKYEGKVAQTQVKEFVSM